MSDLQRQEKDRADMERELLRQRVAQDERFHATQLQKQKKGLLDGRDMQKFRLAQMVSVYNYNYLSQKNPSMGTPSMWTLQKQGHPSNMDFDAN